MDARKVQHASCLGVISTLLIMFMHAPLMARDEIIDDTFNIEIINDKMDNEEAQRVFDYTRKLYDDRLYTEALKGFRAIVDYSESDLRDDSLYYAGKCYYHKNRNRQYIQAFRQVYALFPSGDVVKSGALQETLLNILEKENVKDFYYLMQVYHLLTKFYPSSSGAATETVNSRAKEEVCVSCDFKVPWNTPCTKYFKRGKFVPSIRPEYKDKLSINELMNNKDRYGRGKLCQESAEPAANRLAQRIWYSFFSRVKIIPYDSQTRDLILSYYGDKPLEQTDHSDHMNVHLKATQCVNPAELWTQVASRYSGTPRVYDIFDIGKPAEDDI